MEITKRYSIMRRNLSIDRISDLPDSILCHILSFLPTKISASTSILSRRWRYVWTYTPNLIFQNENQDTITRVLLLHKVQSLNNFSINTDGDGDGEGDVDRQFKTCISRAVERNVQKFYLSHEYYIDLPRCLFTCKTLVELRLENCGVIPKTGALFLPRLKKLHLICVQHEGNESLSHLLSGCPVLEELLIFLFMDYSSCKISSPTIKRLIIEIRCAGDEAQNEDYFHRLEINTPAIVYLQLLDRTNQCIKCGALNSLIEADIDICASVKPKDDLIYSRSVVEFIDRLCNVKCLRLDFSNCTIKIIDSEFSARNKSFQNLTKLDLTMDCPLLLKFLQNADNLEILILREIQRAGAIKRWIEPQQVPTCLLSRLRTIKLVHFVGIVHLFKIVRYLLRNAKVLEMMEIVYPNFLNPDQKIYLLQQISLFERGSSACKVAFRESV